MTNAVRRWSAIAQPRSCGLPAVFVGVGGRWGTPVRQPVSMTDVL
jgi:hypothetical protein